MALYKGQKNIKVHFAGLEDASSLIAALAAEAKYFLFTAYYWLRKRSFDSPMPKLIQDQGRHSIMDSGLYSVMFSRGGKKMVSDQTSFEKWQDDYINLVETSGYTGTIVEVDCQKLVGAEVAWRLRERLKTQLPNRIMNVFHFEDGQRGLDRLIEYSDYLAIGLPELKVLKKQDYAVRLANYIKEKNPDIDIHLLGTSSLTLLKRLRFCTSADSLTWLNTRKFGHVETDRGGLKIERITDETLFQPFSDRYERISQELNLMSNCNLKLMARLAFGAHRQKHRYAEVAGSQD